MNSTTNDGEKREKQMWEDIKAKNWKAMESKIADGFQSVHPDGQRDRANEISLIKNLKVGRVELNDFSSTMNGDNVVVTYMISCAGDNRPGAVADKADSTLECLEKRSDRLAMDLPRQSQPDPLEIIWSMPRDYGAEINF